MEDSFRNAIVRIQTGLSAPKNQFNKFGNYHYRNVEDILMGLKPLLTETRCFIIFDDDIKIIENRWFMVSTVTLSDGKETITGKGIAEMDDGLKGMSNPQKTGAASSYARKYALNSLFAIDDNKDADYDIRTAQDAARQNTKPVTREVNQTAKDDSEAREALFNELRDMGVNIDGVVRFYSDKYGVLYQNNNIPLSILQEAINAKRKKEEAQIAQMAKEAKELKKQEEEPVKQTYHMGGSN